MENKIQYDGGRLVVLTPDGVFIHHATFDEDDAMEFVSEQYGLDDAVYMVYPETLIVTEVLE